MGDQWVTRTSTVNQWVAYARPMGDSWSITVNPWVTDGRSMDDPLVTYRRPMGNPWVGTTVYTHG